MGFFPKRRCNKSMNIIPNKTCQLPYMTPGDGIQIYSTFHGVQSNPMGNLKMLDYNNILSFFFLSYTEY